MLLKNRTWRNIYLIRSQCFSQLDEIGFDEKLVKMSIWQSPYWATFFSTHQQSYSPSSPCWQSRSSRSVQPETSYPTRTRFPFHAWHVTSDRALLLYSYWQLFKSVSDPIWSCLPAEHVSLSAFIVTEMELFIVKYQAAPCNLCQYPFCSFPFRATLWLHFTTSFSTHSVSRSL